MVEVGKKYKVYTPMKRRLLDEAREDFVHDVYNTLDFLPTNDEANRIIDSFDRVTSGVESADVLDKIREEAARKIVKKPWMNFERRERDRNDAFLEVLDIIDKYRKSEVKDGNDN